MHVVAHDTKEVYPCYETKIFIVLDLMHLHDQSRKALLISICAACSPSRKG